MTDSLQLSTECILNAPFNNYEKDFTFIVNNIKYPASTIQADLISPQVRSLHYTDATISEFSITTNTQGNFQIILDLLNFRKTPIEDDQKMFIYEVLMKLGNSDIKCSNEFHKITKETVINNLISHESYLYFSDLIQREIDFISQHFYELIENQLNRKNLMKLSNETLISILTNSKLRLNNEDQLLRFINELYVENKNKSIFYSYVNFTNVSSECISEFLIVFDISSLDNSIWNCLSERLKQTIIKSDNNKERNEHEVEQKSHFPYKNDFDGVINYLYYKSKNEINITSSSVLNNDINRYGPLNAVDFSKRKCFQSDNLPDSWLLFDFKAKKLILSCYTIRSSISIFDSYPMSWKIEGSDDQMLWTELDNQNNSTDLDETHLFHTFQVNNSDHQAFRFIRIRQTDVNSGNDNCLAIDSIELYGQLI